jgi:hypothetical protein
MVDKGAGSSRGSGIDQIDRENVPQQVTPT